MNRPKVKLNRLTDTVRKLILDGHLCSGKVGNITLRIRNNKQQFYTQTTNPKGRSK